MLRGKIRCHKIQNDHGKLPAVGIGVAVYLPGIGTPSWRLYRTTLSVLRNLWEGENTSVPVPGFPAARRWVSLTDQSLYKLDNGFFRRDDNTYQ
jgi:hypothetical protein